MLRLLRHLVFFFSLTAVLGLAHNARADAATAQALFDQGKKLMSEKKYAEACPKFEESQKLDPGLGTQTNLAICYESVGRTASAWSLYLEVAGQAKATNQTERETKARTAAKALEGKLSKLTIKVSDPPEGLEVRRNDVVVGEATWNTPIPVDPGEIKISATAPHRKHWETTIKVEKPGESDVTVPELEEGEEPGNGQNTGPANTGSGPGYYGTVPPPPPPHGPRMVRKNRGMFGGGIAMVVVGGLTTIVGLGWTAAAALTEDAIGPPLGTLAIGLGLVGGGSAMIAIGGKKVPADPAKDGLFLNPVPEVGIGIGSVQAKWQF